MYADYLGKENIAVKFDNIRTKYDLIRAVLKWVSTTEGTDGKYQQKLKYVCESLDTDDMLNCLNKPENRCDYRNEVIHGLMNKNIYSLHSELAQKAEEGMKLATRIDSYVNVVKKGHTIRQSINLKTE